MSKLSEVCSEEYEKMLIETVFKDPVTNEYKKFDTDIGVSSNGQTVELIIGNQRFTVLSEKFIDYVTNQIKASQDKHKKEQANLESKIKVIEKHIMSTNILVEQLKNTNKLLTEQNKQNTAKIQKLVTEIYEIKRK